MRGRGFTILEILLVVTIIALVGTIAGYRFYRVLEHTDLRSTAHRLLYMARYGQMLAAQHHRPSVLHVDLERGRYWLTSRQIRTVTESTFEQEPEQVVKDVYIRPGVLPGKLRFVRAQVEGQAAVSKGQIAINFRVDGSAEAGLVQIGSDQKIYTLLIYPWTARAELKAQATNELPIDTEDLEISGRTPQTVFE